MPQDCKTIQECIDKAKSGDTILVDPGTYVENLRIDKEGLTIRGTDPDPGKIIVQAKFADEPVALIRARDVRLSSLTLTGGSRGLQIESRADKPALSNLVIQGNQAEGLFAEGMRGGELLNSLILRNSKWVPGCSVSASPLNAGLQIKGFPCVHLHHTIGYVTGDRTLPGGTEAGSGWMAQVKVKQKLYAVQYNAGEADGDPEKLTNNQKLTDIVMW